MDDSTKDRQVKQFSKLLSLDQDLQDVLLDLIFEQVRKLWVRRQRIDGQPQPLGTLEDFRESLIVTGSVAEGMVTSRVFREPQRITGEHQSLEVELDMMVLLASFKGCPQKQDGYIEPISNMPGFYKVRKYLSHETIEQENIMEFITLQAKKRFAKRMFRTEGLYVTGGIIKEGFEKLGKFRDKRNLVGIWSSALPGIEVTSVNVKVNTERNGPAVTLNLTLRENERTLVEFSMDGVPCIHLDHWPSGGENWTGRRREWPSSALIKEVMREGCHLVPKMSPDNPEDDQWRLSFSVAERRLAIARTNGQKLTYFVFKSLYYAVIKTVEFEEKTLPSYIAKTLMMWACEEIPVADWTTKDLNSNIQLLFLKLSTALRAGSLEHYFLPKINLLNGMPEQLLEQTVEQIDTIIENPLETVPEGLPEQIGELLERMISFGKNVGDRLKILVDLDEAWKLAKLSKM